jgi:hypothetical protein
MFRLGRMCPAHARSSGSETLLRIRSLAGYIIGTLESRFRKRHPAFRQQIFDVAEAQREPNIEPDRVLDDFGRKAIAAIADLIIADGTAIGQ